MKRLILGATIVVLAAAPAFAAERYISLAAGAWLPGHISSVDTTFLPVSVSYDAGLGIGGAVGVALENGLRLVGRTE